MMIKKLVKTSYPKDNAEEAQRKESVTNHGLKINALCRARYVVEISGTIKGAKNVRVDATLILKQEEIVKRPVRQAACVDDVACRTIICRAGSNPEALLVYTLAKDRLKEKNIYVIIDIY